MSKLRSVLNTVERHAHCSQCRFMPFCHFNEPREVENTGWDSRSNCLLCAGEESLYSATDLQLTFACVLNKTIHMKMNSN